ncbi:Gfo/Idh/MocA family protein [Streptomyces fumanus]|uniref:Oxidoreductase n=1 Tax=Streptomyces fumanus TaxID=67302 RepID=A0A919AIT3_9ACTN|nr:Gfo/Idh/MocA family oxidoreductase [Streptomyces fumanus]GHF09946.1 oxidoreductase [Streptomyces fumanus]
MSASSRLGIGVIGLGRVSPAHLEGYLALPDEAFVAAVCDIDKKKTAAVSTELGVPGFTDYHELLAHPEVDAVVVLLPHLLHHTVVTAAVAAGRHVTVEKPLAVTEDQCRELIRAAQDRGVVLSVSENSRFVAGYLRIKEELDSGRIGGIRLVRAFIYGSAVAELADPEESWKHEEYGFAAVLDAATHFFYVLRWMFEPVVSVQATTRRWSVEHGVPESEVEDGAVVTGRFANGGHFSIEVALNVEVPWGERFEVYGDRGSMVCDQLTDPVVTFHRNAADFGSPLPGVPADPRNWRAASMHRGAADFVRAVRGGHAPAVTAEDATYAVRLAEAAYRSVRAGGIEVAL